MPRWASRINLKIVDVSVEHVQAISESDAKSEGVNDICDYANLWDKINGPESWRENPWVWKISFERIP
jgi:hypothetical protein